MSVLIAGGGVAGAAAACLLGPGCTLIERETGPHDKICGEFLSVEAAGYLRRLGVDPKALGAVAVDRVRLVHGDVVAEAPLPFPALGLSRRVLDEALLARAETLGATVVRGVSVKLDCGVPTVPGLGRFGGHRLFLATGKYDLRGMRRVLTRAPEDLVGLKMYLRLGAAEAASLAGAVEVVLFEGGYAGLQAVEGDGVNLCLLVERTVFRSCGESWAGVQSMLEAQSAHLRRRLADAVTLLDRPLAVFRVPYGFVHRDMEDGVFRLGDQMAVIPSFSGDGVSMALHSAFRAVAGLSGGAGLYHRRVRQDVAGQVGRAWTIYRAGRAAPGAMVRGARLWPGAMQWAARLTRVPVVAGPRDARIA